MTPCQTNWSPQAQWNGRIQRSGPAPLTPCLYRTCSESSTLTEQQHLQSSVVCVCTGHAVMLATAWFMAGCLTLLKSAAWQKLKSLAAFSIHALKGFSHLRGNQTQSSRQLVKLYCIIPIGIYNWTTAVCWVSILVLFCFNRDIWWNQSSL